MKDLVAQIRKELRHNLREHDSSSRIVVAAYLFGSHANAGAGKNSDLDLAFLLDEQAYKNDPLATVSPAYLAATNLGMSLRKKTDVTILNASSLEIAYEVLITGICLWENNSEKRMEYEIALRGMYFDFRPFLEKLRSSCVNNL